MSVWSVWQRWFGTRDQEETARDERRGVDAGKHNEGQLKAELRRLEHQRHTIEQRGCFSDRELDEKDLELERLDRRISAVKQEQFRVRAFGKSGGR